MIKTVKEVLDYVNDRIQVHIEAALEAQASDDDELYEKCENMVFAYKTVRAFILERY